MFLSLISANVQQFFFSLFLVWFSVGKQKTKTHSHEFSTNWKRFIHFNECFCRVCLRLVFHLIFPFRACVVMVVLIQITRYNYEFAGFAHLLFCFHFEMWFNLSLHRIQIVSVGYFSFVCLLFFFCFKSSYFLQFIFLNS